MNNKMFPRNRARIKINKLVKNMNLVILSFQFETMTTGGCVLPEDTSETPRASPNPVWSLTLHF